MFKLLMEKVYNWSPVIIFIIISALVYFLSNKFELVLRNALNSDSLKLTNLTNTLISVASIIFAISGAWIALIFPKAIKNLKKNKVREITSEDEEAAFYDISICSVVSLSVLFMVVIINYILSVAVIMPYKIDVFYYSFIVVSSLYFLEAIVVLWTAKTTFKVFSSYSMAIMNRSTIENIESVPREEDDN